MELSNLAIGVCAKMPGGWCKKESERWRAATVGSFEKGRPFFAGAAEVSCDYGIDSGSNRKAVTSESSA